MEPVAGAERLFVGSIESTEYISTLGLRLLVRRIEALGPSPCAMLRLPVDTFDFFHLKSMAELRSTIRASESSNEETALIKANYSCFRMTPAHEALLTHNRHLANELVRSSNNTNHNSLL
jgi:hypothetical protein